MQIPTGDSSSSPWLMVLLAPFAYALYDEVASQVVKAGCKCVARAGRRMLRRIKPSRKPISGRRRSR